MDQRHDTLYVEQFSFMEQLILYEILHDEQQLYLDYTGEKTECSSIPILLSAVQLTAMKHHHYDNKDH